MSALHGVLAMGRTFTESRFTETVTIGLFEDGTDPVTGDPTRVPVGAPSYSGAGQVKYPSAVVSEVSGAGQVVAAQDVLVKLPSGTVVHVGDEVVVTASTADSSLVGCVYRVKGAAQKGQTTSARYPVVELP